MNRKIFTCDAYEAGFEIYPVSSNKDDYVYKDLKLTRFSKNYQEIDDTTLFAINGLIHPTIVKEDGIYIKNGNNPYGQRITLIRTNLIGELKKYNIKPEQITNPNRIDPSIEHGIYLNTDFDLYENFYLLIIFGNLFVGDSRFKVIDSNTILIKQISLDLDKKFLHSIRLFNNDELEGLILNDTTLNRKEFFKFDILKEILSNENSFIVNMGTKLKCNKTLLGSHRLPGKYIIDENTNDLLMSKFGKVLDYQIKDDTQQPIINGEYYNTSKARSFTTDNINITTIVNDLPYVFDYEDIYKLNVFLEETN